MDRYLPREELSGSGRLLRYGEVVAEGVDYEITVSRESDVPGVNSIEGRISPPFPLQLIGEPIELELKDGRRWRCIIQSDSGSLVNRGGIN
jgi:hypothetical protein